MVSATRRGYSVIDRITAENTLSGLSVVAVELIEDIHERLAAKSDFLSGPRPLHGDLVRLGEDILALGRAAEVISRREAG